MRELRPGYWQLRVSLGRDAVTGKPKYRTRGLRGSRREAGRALARLIADVDMGKAEPSSDSVGTLLDLWLAHIEREGRSPTTLRNYQSLRAQLPKEFLSTSMRKLTPRTLDALYVQLSEKPGRGPSSIKHIHAMLRTAFNQAMRWELLDRNPAALASPPRVPAREIEPPPVSEVVAVIEAAERSNNSANALIFRFIAATGCRRSEACALRWNDVDTKVGKVTIRRAVVQVGSKTVEKDTKAHQQRRVRLDPSTLEELKRHHRHMKEIASDFEVRLPADAFVFSDEPDGSMALQPDRLSQAWRRLADQVGTTARLHDLRHLQASLLLDAGEAITTVAARLGHRDMATTLRVYAHLMPGADERAAEVVGSAFGEASQ
jgi:integrase